MDYKYIGSLELLDSPDRPKTTNQEFSHSFINETVYIAIAAHRFFQHIVTLSCISP